MDILTSIFLGISLAMDCLAISACISCVSKVKLKDYISIPFHFGFFQFMMTTIGYYFGYSFNKYIEAVDHWVAFFLLAGIGLKMIIDSLKKDVCIPLTSEKMLLSLSVATSLDALIVGVTLSMINSTILATAIIIGLLSLIISLIGLKIGCHLAKLNLNYAGVIGGLILIAIGLKILFSDLFF